MKLTVTTNVSVDGVMQGLGGPDEDRRGGFDRGGWAIPLLDTEAGDHINEFYGGAAAFLFGRRTYEIFAAYWPYVGGEATGIGEVFDRTGKDEGEAEAIAMGEAFTKADKYVLIRGSPDLTWSNSHRVGSLDELRTIGDGDGPDLLIQGSSTLYPALLEAGMLDQLTVIRLACEE